MRVGTFLYAALWAAVGFAAVLPDTDQTITARGLEKRQSCGPYVGFCSGSCCSQWGWCGTTSAHCGAGCQPAYGSMQCSPPEMGRCGSGVGPCRPGYCCSQWGWCGTTDAYCGAGCQSSFGRCGNHEIRVSKDGTCGVTPYGTFTCNGTPWGGKCCSKWGWCGATADHCGTGCQSQYGTCW